MSPILTQSQTSLDTLTGSGQVITRGPSPRVLLYAILCRGISPRPARPGISSPATAGAGPAPAGWAVGWQGNRGAVAGNG